MPEPAIWIFDTVGLCVFIGVVGSSAGPGFVTGLQKTGVSLAVVGLVCSLIPHTVAHPLRPLRPEDESADPPGRLRRRRDDHRGPARRRGRGRRASSPRSGYTVPYAIGNILLTAWGPVIVALMTIGR